MSRPFISKPTQRHVTYAAMSLLIGWHTVAMVLAGAPDSVITRAGRSLLQPYLTLFRLDTNWGFFAPEVPRGHQFRYIIEDAVGKRHTFAPDEELSRYGPVWIWFSDHHTAVIDTPEDYADADAAFLCRRHGSLHPVSVTLLDAEQKDFWPVDQLNGKHPLDPEFVDVNVVKTVRCPDQ
jgi:hypothetical protein